jgi:stage V sporulation protein B
VNIFGSPIGSAIGYGITCCLDLFLVWRIVPGCPSFFVVFSKPLIASALMGGAAWAVYGLVFRVIARNAVALILAIAVAVVVYFAMLLLMRTITKDDLALMPKGEQIGRLLHIR